MYAQDLGAVWWAKRRGHVLACCSGRDGEGWKTRGGASFLPLMQRRSSIYSLVPCYVIEQQSLRVTIELERMQEGYGDVGT